MSRSNYLPDRRRWAPPDLRYKRWEKRNLVPKAQVKERYEGPAIVRDELAELAAIEAETLKIASAHATLQMDRDLADAYDDYPYDFDWYDSSDEDYVGDEYYDERWEAYLQDEARTWLDGATLYESSDYYYYDRYENEYIDDDYDTELVEHVPTPPPPIALADPDLVARGRRAARRVRAKRK